MRNSKGQYDALPGFVVNVLPTPTARDWKSGASSPATQRRNSRPLSEVALLLPTPTASDGTGGAGTSPNRKGGMNLRTAVTTLPTVADAELVQDWAEYEPAIRRQEAVTGRAAPLPTELGPRGGRRLTARFAEWLMGLPDGWVTAVPGLNRSRQLHKIGNGVAPLQAYEAYRRLLALDGPQQEEPETLF